MSRYTRRTQSRLGGYERQKFGGSGHPQFEGLGQITPLAPGTEYNYTGFMQIPTTPVATDTAGTPLPSGGAPWRPGYTPTPTEVTASQGGADTGTNWGAVGGFVSSFIGALAPVAGGLYMQSQQAAQQKDLMQMAQQAAMAQSQPQQPTIIMQGGGGGSKKGLYIGLGVAALAAVIVIIILVSR